MTTTATPTAAAATPSPTVAVAPKVRTWAVIRRLVARFRPYPLRTAFCLGVSLARTAVDVSVPFLLGRTIGSLGGHEGTSTLPSSFQGNLVLLVTAIVVRAILQYVTAVATAALGQDVENGLRSELFAKTMRLRFRWHDENRAGKTIARSLGDMEKAKAFFREVAFGYVEIALLLVGVVSLSFVIHWTYGVAATALFGVVAVATARVGVRIAQMDRGVSDTYDRVTTTIQENVAGARVVRAFGQEPGEVERFGGRLGRYSTEWRAMERYWTTLLPIIHHGMNLVVAVTLGVAGFRMVAAPTHETFADATAVLLYMRLARERTRPLIRLVLVGQKSVASATRVFEVLDTDSGYAATLPAGTQGPSSSMPAPRGARPDGEVVFEHVSFAYPGGPAVLSDVSLAVPAGGSLGILGRTGAGKTTLVHLLPRFYDPTAGRVLLDGADVKDLDPRELARSVALVFQEPFLFSATVHENVAYGRPDATRAEVEEACRLAAAHEFVVTLPKGYDTMVGERGVSLSGGQRQRLTIARALLVRPRVLVFDDATASVDAVTEKDLFRGIRSAAKGRTSIVISQRVTSVRWCDRIAVLEGGRLTGIASHDQLIATNALYREVFEHQSLERQSLREAPEVTS